MSIKYVEWEGYNTNSSASERPLVKGFGFVCLQIKALFTPFFIFLIESLISCQEKQYQQGKCAHAVSGRGQGSGLKPQKDYSLCVFSASEHMHLSLSSFIALPQLTKLFALIITRYLFLPPFCSSFEHRFPPLSGKKKKSLSLWSRQFADITVT